MNKFCTYFENGHLIEHDMVDPNEIRDYFKDSYRHHTGRNPSKTQIKDYADGLSVMVLSNNLQQHWKCG